MKNYSQILLILLSILAIEFSVRAQRIQSKVDSIKLVNGLEGHVVYEIDTRKNEDDFNGSFEFYQSKKDTTREEFAIGVLYEGGFVNDQKEGEWVYTFSRLEPSKLKRVERTNIIYAGTGGRFFIQGEFEKNMAVGEWVSVHQEIELGNPVDTTFLAITNFQENKMTGNFNSWCDSVRIEGEIDENGFLEGVWKFYQTTEDDKLIEEQRTYESGVLVKHQIIIDEKELHVKHIGLDKTVGGDGENWEEVNVSKDYFNIIFKTNFGVESDALSLEETNDLIGKSNAFLKYSIFSFGRHDDVNIWQIEDGKDIVYPKLRVRKFPYTDEEKEQIESGLKLIKESTEIIEDYLNDPQVDINRYNYKEISLYYEIYKVYNRELKKLKNVFEKLNLYTYEYVNRDKILPYLLKDGIQYPDEITYEYDDQKLSEAYEFPEGISSDNRSIKNMSLHLEAINNSLIETKKQVEPIIEKNRKRAEIAEKESELVKKRDSIIDLFNDKENREDYNTYHESFKEDVNVFIMDRFKTYANKDVEERLGKTQFVIDCFKTIGTLYSKLVDLEEKKERIEESYKREVWSPVTYTYMTETIKERIYNAYKNYLLDKVVDDIKKSIGCEKLDEKMENISILYKEMMAIRDRDTSKEERALRRVKDADKILSILNIKLN